MVGCRNVLHAVQQNQMAGPFVHLGTCATLCQRSAAPSASAGQRRSQHGTPGGHVYEYLYIYNGVLGRAAPLLVRLAQELVQALGAQGVVCDRVEALEGCLEPSLSLLVICRAQQASASADASTSVDRATSRRRAKLASLADLVRVAGRCESSRENAHSPRSLLPTCAAQGACPPPAASVTLTLPRLLQVQATVPTLSHESCVFQGEDTSITIVGFGGV